MEDFTEKSIQIVFWMIEYEGPNTRVSCAFAIMAGGVAHMADFFRGYAHVFEGLSKDVRGGLSAAGVA